MSAAANARPQAARRDRTGTAGGNRTQWL